MYTHACSCQVTTSAVVPQGCVSTFFFKVSLSGTATLLSQSWDDKHMPPLCPALVWVLESELGLFCRQTLH